ncbi:MAG: AAC(3) family N-acetyltransferase [Victivallales bacterium]|nr:AAC(3) family N-acetyltransferase [Victivallales bacterium]
MNTNQKRVKMLKKEEFISQLKAIGIEEGMDVLVHSSMKSIGPVEGGADTVIDALQEVLGEDGTLMMSTVSGNVNKEQPVFHVDHTPGTVGILSNIFRKRKGAVRSMHPVHSIVAMGPKAKFYTDGHLESNTPWSPDSPYGKIMRNGAKVFFIGTDFECNTCMHALEIEAKVPGLHTEETQTLYIFDSNNNMHTIEHHWHSPKKDYYTNMESIVAKAGGLTYGQIGMSISRFVDAETLRKVMLPIFQNTPELAIKRLSENTFIWE